MGLLECLLLPLLLFRPIGSFLPPLLNSLNLISTRLSLSDAAARCLKYKNSCIIFPHCEGTWDHKKCFLHIVPLVEMAVKATAANFIFQRGKKRRKKRDRRVYLQKRGQEREEKSFSISRVSFFPINLPPLPPPPLLRFCVFVYVGGGGGE